MGRTAAAAPKRRQRAGRINGFRAALLAALVVLAAGVAYWLVARTAPSLPADDEAIAIFRPLHRNIYDAFAAADEEAIYDTLAASLHGAALDRVYDEIYRSLVARRDQGAEVRIKLVELTDARVVDKSGDGPGPRFVVDCTWFVLSDVAHGGHTHSRMHDYRGLYTVARVDGEWRIVDDRILSQKRLAAPVTDLPPVEQTP